MVAIAIGLVWAGYFGGLYGYCLIRGYNVTPKQLLSSQWPPQSAPSAGGGAGGGGGGSWGDNNQRIPQPGGGTTPKPPGPGSAYGGK